MKTFRRVWRRGNEPVEFRDHVALCSLLLVEVSVVFGVSRGIICLACLVAILALVLLPRRPKS